jgi:DNA-binding GntR family transcriptional regulator
LTLQLKPLTTPPAQSVSDFVFETLYAAVVRLDLPPGTRLSEAEVAERIKVWQLITEQEGHMDRARFLSLSLNTARAHREHEDILRELARGDAAAAKAQVELHLSRIHTDLPKIREARPDYFRDCD